MIFQPMGETTVRKITLLFAAVVASILASSIVTPAFAQATRTWVSGVGDDANPCSRTAPCKTFAGAISKTLAGGEISVLDPGGFGAVTITKSISLINDFTGEAGILSSGVAGVVINADPTDIVILRGLVVDGAPPGTPGTNGINFLAGGALHVEKCLIKNYTAAAPNGNGIRIANSAGTAKVDIVNTDIVNNLVGLEVIPSGSASATVAVTNSTATGGVTGFRANGTATTGMINLTIKDSMSANNSAAGINATGGTSAGAQVMVVNTASVNNGTGVVSSGAAATMRLAGSTITGNNLSTNVSGTLSSYNNNFIDGNTTAGPNPGIIGTH
jgi:hypothetical protein